MRKQFLVVPMILLLVTIASAAITLEVVFGTGITHNISNISATMGAPVIGTQYYFVGSAPYASTSASSAVVVSKTTTAGRIVFQEVSKIGSCSWKAIVGNNAKDIADLNGIVVDANTEIKWSVEPTSATVTLCKLVFDMNVVSS